MAYTARFSLLNGQTAAGSSGSGNTLGAGDGQIFELSYPHLASAVQAEIFGAPTACVINIMGLIDGQTWDTLATLDITAGYASGEIQPLTYPVPIRAVKANLATLSGGSAPSVNLYFSAWG